MIQSKDFIERMIEQFSRGVAKIAQMKERGQYVQAMEEVNLIYDDYFEDFELEVEQNELKLQSYAQLQKIKGEILLVEGDSVKAMELFQEAYCSLQRADKISRTFDFNRIKLMNDLDELQNTISQ